MNPRTSYNSPSRFAKSPRLPIFASRGRLVNAVRNNSVVILEGATGSGKTTQVPQFLVQAGFAKRNKRVCCTQPRRVAAMSIAKRVAKEMKGQIGQQVGYKVRFDDMTSRRTQLVFETEAMLLREAMSDPMLSAYSVIIVDEAHERTINTDVLMGILKEIQKKRKDLRVVVMSATMETERFQNYFEGAPLLSVPGRMFPVDVVYSKTPESNYVDAAVSRALSICKNEAPGDILIFLTGEEEIKEACSRIEEGVHHLRGEQGPVKVYSLYGALSADMQQKAFEPAPAPSHKGGRPGRKIICSTNIAEASLTIDGVAYVIDTGLMKQKIYNPRARLESLVIAGISKASANQRMGRAGRTKRGKCYRLFTRESFEMELPASSCPEIWRCNLANVVLQMLTLGVKNIVKFDFMDPPAPETMMRALETLFYLGAIDGEGRLTDLGALMAKFPLEPEASAALIKSVKHNCSQEVLTIMAMMSEAPNCLLLPKSQNRSAPGQVRKERPPPWTRFQDARSDHLTLLNVYNACKEHEVSKNSAFQWCKRNSINYRALRAADSVRKQLEKTMRRYNLKLVHTPKTSPAYRRNIGKALLSGYFMRVAHHGNNPGEYLTAKDEEIATVHASSGMCDDIACVMYHEFVLNEKSGFLRTCSGVEANWLLEVVPHFFNANNLCGGMANTG